MSVIRCENVRKQFAGQVVLDGIDLELQPGEVIGLIGANGAGKTTLFRCIAGLMEPDVGRVDVARSASIGLLHQEPNVDLDATVRDEVAEAAHDLHRMEQQLHDLSDAMATLEGDALSEKIAEYDRLRERFEQAGGLRFEARLGEVLGGLGFTPADYDQPIRTLSGGQRGRVALAKLLVDETSFLLLDEPTNHLDLDAVRWLERFLAHHPGGALVISHDRYLLDRIADGIVELDRGKVVRYPGNYSNFRKTKAARELEQQRRFEQDREFIAKERDFINRFRAGQRAKEARGRETRLQRRIADGEFVLEAPPKSRQMKIQFRGDNQLDVQELVRIDGLRKAYDDVLFDKLDLRLQAGQRLGIVGPNGAGKSTLIKIILGRAEADAGSVRVHDKANVGYFSQTPEELDPNSTAIEYLRAAHPRFTEADARHVLAWFGFTGDMPFDPLRTFSGGEQSRLRLLKIVLEEPNVLVLDEPTNHLDILTCEAIETALQHYPGTVITVSHDRYFLDAVIDRVLLLRPPGAGGHRYQLGTYSELIATLEKEAEADAKAAEAAKKASRSRQTASKPGSTKSKWEKMGLAKLEAFLMEQEAAIEEAEAGFVDPDVYSDAEKLATLKAKVAAMRAELHEAEDAYYTLAEA